MSFADEAQQDQIKPGIFFQEHCIGFSNVPILSQLISNMPDNKCGNYMKSNLADNVFTVLGVDKDFYLFF